MAEASRRKLESEVAASMASSSVDVLPSATVAGTESTPGDAVAGAGAGAGAGVAAETAASSLPAMPVPGPVMPPNMMPPHMMPGLWCDPRWTFETNIPIVIQQNALLANH